MPYTSLKLCKALPIGKPERHVGLADHDRPGRFQTSHRESVGVGTPILEFGIAPGGRQAGDVELLFDGHRHTEQRAALAPRQSRVGGIGRRPRPVEIADDDRIDLFIERLDPGNREIEQLARRDLSRRERSDEVTSGAVGRSDRFIEGGGRAAGSALVAAAALAASKTERRLGSCTMDWSPELCPRSSPRGLQASMPVQPRIPLGDRAKALEDFISLS